MLLLLLLLLLLLQHSRCSDGAAVPFAGKVKASRTCCCHLLNTAAKDARYRKPTAARQVG
jgi:hypothetical protein